MSWVQLDVSYNIDDHPNKENILKVFDTWTSESEALRQKESLYYGHPLLYIPEEDSCEPEWCKVEYLDDNKNQLRVESKHNACTLIVIDLFSKLNIDFFASCEFWEAGVSSQYKLENKCFYEKEVEIEKFDYYEDKEGKRVYRYELNDDEKFNEESDGYDTSTDYDMMDNHFEAIEWIKRYEIN